MVEVNVWDDESRYLSFRMLEKFGVKGAHIFNQGQSISTKLLTYSIFYIYKLCYRPYFIDELIFIIIVNYKR